MKNHWFKLFRLGISSAALFLTFINMHADIVYVWSNDGSIQKYDENGSGSLFTTNDLSGWNGPVGLALDNVGNLYAGVPGESRVWKFSPSGAGSWFAAIIDSVSGLAFDSTGRLFATSPNYMEIFSLDFDPRYGYFQGDSTNYSQFHLSYPISLVFDRAGNIYTANASRPIYNDSPYTNTIEKFSKNFANLGSFATNLNKPWGLAFDSAGNLHVSNSGTNGALRNTIVKFTPDGVRSTFATALSGLNSPQGLAFDSAGNLYVANSGNGTIVKFTTNGTASVFASGLNSPSSIAIFPGLNLWSATAIKLGNPTTTSNGMIQFSFKDNPGLSFSVLCATNMPLSLAQWTTIGPVAEKSPGFYQFIDPQATNGGQRFYRIVHPTNSQ